MFRSRMALLAAMIMGFGALASLALADNPRASSVGESSEGAPSPMFQLTAQSLDWGLLMLSQPPLWSNGFFSDTACDGCPSGQQSIADDFVVQHGNVLSTIVLEGLYFPGNTAPDEDDFTLRIHQTDLGTVIYSESGIAYDRVMTSTVVFGANIWQYAFYLDGTVYLAPGTYWIEIFNNTTGNDSHWTWGNGTLDPTNGIAGFAFSQTAPGVSWTPQNEVVTMNVIGARESVGVYNPSSFVWTLAPGIEGPFDFTFGSAGAIPVMGDWDGDGTDTPGLYYPASGIVELRNSNSSGDADLWFWYGIPGDILVAGDWTGSGSDSVGVYRPSSGRVFLLNELPNANGAAPTADISYYFGIPGDKPFAGDFDRDGIDTIGLHRESTGLVYFTNGHETAFADHSFVYGIPGDQLVAGDWLRVDGIDSVAVWRQSEQKFYLRHANDTGAGTLEFSLDVEGLAVAGKFREQ